MYIAISKLHKNQSYHFIILNFKSAKQKKKKLSALLVIWPRLTVQIMEPLCLIPYFIWIFDGILKCIFKGCNYAFFQIFY